MSDTMDCPTCGYGPLRVSDFRPRWRHVKRGTEYIELMRGKFQNSDETSMAMVRVGRRSLDNESVVIYQSVDDQQVYVRLVSEFEDGRFERVS